MRNLTKITSLLTLTIMVGCGEDTPQTPTELVANTDIDKKKTEESQTNCKIEEDVNNGIIFICENKRYKIRDGVDGKDGVDGFDGIDGKDGRDGKDGKNGEKGDRGLKGDQGERGIQGLKGDKGDKGDQGLEGEGFKRRVVEVDGEVVGILEEHFPNNDFMIRSFNGDRVLLRNHFSVDVGFFAYAGPDCTGEMVSAWRGSDEGQDVFKNPHDGKFYRMVELQRDAFSAQSWISDSNVCTNAPFFEPNYFTVEEFTDFSMPASQVLTYFE